MREWALETLHKQVRLADPPWVRRGNTGAVLAVVEFVPQHQRLKAVIAVSWGFGAVLGMR